jgi:hypothetical protein
LNLPVHGHVAKATLAVVAYNERRAHRGIEFPLNLFDSSEMRSLLAGFITVLICGRVMAAEPQNALVRFRAVTIDDKIQIGYGVTVADVDGDGKPDILLADKRQFVWYRNPGWQKFVLAENLTSSDNVCIAAADLDGDGKAEIAVGAGWNPSDTVNGGAVFYLVPPADRTQLWKPVELPHEPTVHRMRWIRNRRGEFELVVVPLHGHGNKDGQGAGVKILAYGKPADPQEPWHMTQVNDLLHLTHNFHVVQWAQQSAGELLVASKEGVFHLVPHADGWESTALITNSGPEGAFRGAGEVRSGRLPGGGRFVATIEPMHGNDVVVYRAPGGGTNTGTWPRQVLDATLKEGHALACGDLLGTGSDQIVVGWRDKDANGKTGIKVFIPPASGAMEWKEVPVDDGIACEDLCLADVNGDGRLDIIASGRATKNVKIYFNEGRRAPGD